MVSATIQTPAGRDLDKLIAEKVMGLTVVTTQEETSQFDPAGRWVYGSEYYEVDVDWALPSGIDPESNDFDDHFLRRYSTEWGAAGEVVNYFERLGYDIALHTTHADGWVCAIRGALVSDSMQAPTAPHAICLAALKSVGVLS